MKRRRFVQSICAAPILTAEGQEAAQSESRATANRQFFELRAYHLSSGPQTKLTDAYLADALIPGLNRMGMQPIGAFNLYLGPETPVLYLLIPSSDAQTLVTAELKLSQDEQFTRSAASFYSAAAKEPAFTRIESQLMIAFEGYPRVTPPPPTATKGPRVFQMRTYESPSLADHRRKVEMFNSGEFDIFAKTGFWNVFFGDTLIGPRLPQLTYMVSFPDLAQLNANWKAFQSDPDWKKLSGSPRFSFEPIVSNISNLILNPTSYSQI